MLCDKFSEAWYNGNHYVARRKLRPFCLWHYTYLHFVNSPLAPGEKINTKEVPDWPDIEMASRICQLGYPEQLPVSISPWLRARLFFVMAKTTLDKELKAYQNYIEDYFAAPKFNIWKDGRHGPAKKRGNPPDPLSVASAVIMMFGGGPSTEKYVWEMPIGKAYWYASTLHFNRGANLDYMTAKDEAWRNFLRSQRAKGLL